MSALEECECSMILQGHFGISLTGFGDQVFPNFFSENFEVL